MEKSPHDFSPHARVFMVNPGAFLPLRPTFRLRYMCVHWMISYLPFILCEAEGHTGRTHMNVSPPLCVISNLKPSSLGLIP